MHSVRWTGHMAGSTQGCWCHCISFACCCLAPWWEKAPWDAAAMSLGSQTCLHLLCGQHGSCPSIGLSLHGLLPLPIPLVPSKAQLQMKPSFSPHVFSHCFDASFPAQSFGNSSCPPQLRPFFPLSLRQAARYASKPWSLTKS